ncbi:mevalonate kinase family protein [Sanguibacter sp. Z1732]|uniref:mevalonate kinase family protein n=1 Tax=Sanguibacter sp. Z1732 TaxID=3435412 RepID=UPI003D9C92CD
MVADTGVRASTDDAVAGVRQIVDADPALGRSLLARLGDLTRAAVLDLEQAHLTAFGRRLTEAQDALTDLGVGHPAIDRLVTAALDAGAAGAKLTGAGRGGCVIAVTPDAASGQVVQSAMTAAGAVAGWIVTLGAT